MDYDAPQDIYTDEDLANVIAPDKTIHQSITIRGEYLREINGVEKIVGNLGSVDSKLESFGSLIEVTGDIWFSIHDVALLVKDLGKLEKVGGDLRLNDLNIKSLGGLRRVGGTLNLRNVPVIDFGKLEFVGGNILLHKNLQGKFDLSRIEVVGKVKYFNDQKSRLDNIPDNSALLAESEIPVPLWKKVYAYSVAVLDSANAEQKRFYDYFKQSFLNDKIVDVRGNTNYVFALMFDLIKDFRTHRNEGLVTRQLTALENAYPIIQRYTEENLTAAIKGEPEKPSPENFGITVSLDFDEALKELQREHPELFEPQEEGANDLELEDDEYSDEFDNDDFDDGENHVEKYRFPINNPVYAVILTEIRDKNYECLETSITINEKPVGALKARVKSIRADVLADRLFIQTLHSENEDSFSIFCFELSTGKRLWQTSEIPPSGVLYVDAERKRLEAGLTYGYAENYLVLLDYNGNILERNFGSGYEMIDAAQENFKNNEFEKAKDLFLQALETAISISTKIKAAKKLACIGKLTGDETLFARFTERATEFETEKESEKKRADEESVRRKSPLAERLARGGKRQEPDDAAEIHSGASLYWNKRWKQIETEGGS